MRVVRGGCVREGEEGSRGLEKVREGARHVAGKI